MSFCSKCGTQFDGSFCPACGTPAAAQAQPFVQPQPGTYGYAKPKIPGRGLGISGMVLGIIGLVYGVYMLLASISYADSYTSRIIDLSEGFTTNIILFSVLSILGVSLSAAGRNKGYKCGISTSGIVMGIIGIALYLISYLVIAGA